MSSARVFEYPNAPLNVPALEALEAMNGGVAPDSLRDQILAAPFSDDLSGLRLFGQQWSEPDLHGWRECSQPKKKIGEYVEACGFKVPKRYETLKEALGTVEQGNTIVVRSEHPWEYDTFSGLLESYRIDSKALGRERHDFIKAINRGASEDDILYAAKRDGLGKRPIQRYLNFVGKSIDEYCDEMSFSFWEYTSGRNIAVVADDAIDGRYHITAHGAGGRGGACGGIFNADGMPFSTIDAEADSLTVHMPPGKIAELVGTYENIRSLPAFSERQCPIMEIQIDDNGGVWFLQYHASRPFRPNMHRLNPADYPEQDGWLKAEAVRGAIGTFVTLRAALWYPDRYDPTMDYSEDASFDMHHDTGLSELQARKRAAYFSTQTAKGLFRNMADGSHELRSRWFKPSGSLAIGRVGYERLIPREKKDVLLEGVRQGHMGRFAIDVASDGLSGFVRLNQDVEQPDFERPI